MKLIENKVAIVSGSGRGIGAATAKLLAQHRAKVIVSDLDEAPAAETCAAIQADNGEAVAFPGDVTDPDFAAAIMQKAVDTYGGLDILVNNAGYTWDGMTHKISDKQWDAIIAVHLTAPFRMIRASAAVMREQAKQEMAQTGQAQVRKIINISSTSGVYGNLGQINYAAGKSGIIGLTKTVAKEWGRFNIYANVVAYGWIDTRLTADKAQGETIEIDGQRVALGIPRVGANEEEARHQRIPLGRPGTVEEAAGPILFLASPLSNYVTGEVIMVTGGW